MNHSFAAILLTGLLSACTSDTISGNGSVNPGTGGDPTPSPARITILGPVATGSYSTSSASISLSGTSSGNISQLTWVNDRGGSGVVIGTSSWTASNIPLQSGTNTITVAAGNIASAAIVVTRGVPIHATFYLSPSGHDTNNDGLSVATPWKTFLQAFSRMAGGDELILLDGTYSETNNTGYISYLGTNSAQPPSGLDLNQMTYIHALNPGRVTINGGLFLGRSTRKDSFIVIRGLSFEGGGDLFNTSYVTIKDCGFHGSFGIGTNDHDNGNEYNLIEDSWVWAAGERVIAINYRAHHNVWRRVLVRGDGCGTASCSGSGNPNVGFTVYNSMDVSVQNVMVVDRVLAPTDSVYADFAVAQHAPGPQFGRNEWLGTLSLKSPDAGYYMEPDVGGTVDPTIKISNAIAWDATEAGFNLARAGTNNVLEHLTANGKSADGIRVAPELLSGNLQNVISINAGRYGINSAYTPSFANVFNASVATYNQTICSSACYSSDPRSDGTPASLRYLPRIEAGSFLKGKGSAGSDIGANILYQYGIEGTRFGDAGYNTLTTVSLWPWPNEARIKSEMCATTTRGFCATGTRLDGINPITLTSYIWEALGNSLPNGIYP